MINHQPKVSIVIPTKEINGYLRESLSYILNLDYQNFEVLILPDSVLPEQKGCLKDKRVRVRAAGRVSPAEKRDLALKYVKGEILAFLDDDAYPQKDWLRQAIKHFKNPRIAAVGGPAVTPQEDSFWQKVSGAVFLSKLSGGNPERYWPVGKAREVNDWPSVNLLVRKADFSAADGFDCQFWPGEDTKLCLDLIKKLNKKIIYNPGALVYHHRRSGLKEHLKQIGNYGVHRGFFAKRYPENSSRFKYFLPAGFFVFVMTGWSLLPLSPYLKSIYWGLWILYGLTSMAALFSIYYKIKDLKVSLAAIPYIFLTHLYYGWRFIKGFVFTKNLKSKLKR